MAPDGACEVHRAQLEAIHCSKQSDFDRDFQGNMKCCRIQRRLLEQRFRALSGFEAWPSSDFERPVAAEHADATISSRKNNSGAAFWSFVAYEEACSSSDFEC